MGNADAHVQPPQSLQADILPRTTPQAITTNPQRRNPHKPYVEIGEPNSVETKGHYRRDDPSFAVLLSFFLCVAALAWGLAYARGFLSIVKLMVFMVGVDFALVGLVIATSAWVLARRFLRGGRRTVGVSADVIAGLGA